MAELPSSVGLGTSSSFVVGVLNTLYAFQGRVMHPLDLAYQAIELEREVLGESVGCQDQTFAAMGGFNLIEFRTTRDIVVHRLPLSAERQAEFESHLLVVYTGIRHRASQVAARQIERIGRNAERLKQMRRQVDEGYEVLAGGKSLSEFGRLLDEGWRLKNSLDDGVSNDQINAIYEQGLQSGAWGGKLLGAGGGGFILFFVPPEKRTSLVAALGNLETISIGVNASGTQIVHASMQRQPQFEEQPSVAARTA